ncbi:MAG: hypothetical protein ACE10D_01245 [Planctomycetota bacterium]
MTEQRVWIEVGLCAQEADYYCGTIDEVTLNKITGDLRSDGFFRLRDVCWTDPAGQIREPVRGKDGPGGGSKTIYFKIETVRRLVVLDDARQAYGV